MSVQNIKINPMYVYIGKDTAQQQTITCKADVTGASLGGKYFVFHDPAGAKRYAWFDTGSSVDPAPAGGWTGHTVVIAPNATASAVATALAAVLTAVTGFDATASGSVVTLVCTSNGYAMPARNPEEDPTKNVGFAFKVTVLGQLRQSAGCIDGDIEISGFEQDVEELKCHATGSTVRGEIIKGYTKPEMTLTFQETSKQKLQDVMVLAGMPVFIPIGADKVAVFGYGPANVGKSNPQVVVELHPVALDASDKSEDFTFWKAQANLDTLNFSGENRSLIPVTFSIYPDESKPAGIQFFMIGDAAVAGY